MNAPPKTRSGQHRCLTAFAPAIATPPEMVDVVFDLTAEMLPPGHEWPLYQAVSRLAPWFGDSPHSGIHPIRGTRAEDGTLVVAKRAKLVVRMPRDRVCAASILEGATLGLGSTTARLGQGTFRKFRPSPTLYSPRVATGDAEEMAFAVRIAGELEALGIRGSIICGKRVEVAYGQGVVAAYSVAVTGLNEADSILLQSAGLGIARPVGCGLFVPHKTISAAQ